MGLYNADIAGLFGGIGGGIPLFPSDVEEDEEALAYFWKNEINEYTVLTIKCIFLAVNNIWKFQASNQNYL